jgi:hypothetical protein
MGQSIRDTEIVKKSELVGIGKSSLVRKMTVSIHYHVQSISGLFVLMTDYGGLSFSQVKKVLRGLLLCFSAPHTSCVHLCESNFFELLRKLSHRVIG